MVYLTAGILAFIMLIGVIVVRNHHTAAIPPLTDVGNEHQIEKVQTIRWYSKYGYVFKARMIDDFDILQNGMADTDYIVPGCQNILHDVATARSYPAVPNKQANSDWQSALSYYAQGAQDCINGTTNGNGYLVQKASDEISQAHAKIESLSSYIEALPSA